MLRAAFKWSIAMAKKRKRILWTKADDKAIKMHSKLKTRVSKIAKLLKRTERAVRQRGFGLGVPIGHQRAMR